MALIELEHTLIIKRPVEEVFDFVATVENFPRWTKSTVSAVKTSPGPVGEGTTCNVVNKSMGRTVDHDFVVSEFVANKLYATKSTAGPFPMDMRYTLEAVDEGTRLHVETSADLSGFISLAGPLIRVVRRRRE